MKPHLLVALAACAGTPAPLAHRAAADAIACSEAQLRSLAGHLPRAELAIAITTSQDTRGAADLPCTRAETDDACLARARREIPRGFVELTADGGGYVTGDVEWEMTLEIDGRTVVKRMPEEMPEIEDIYEAIGHRAKLISQRRVATPDERHAIVWYGYQQPHREAKLTFPPATVELDEERIRMLEATLGLYDLGVFGEYRRGEPDNQWVVKYTCKTYGAGL